MFLSHISSRLRPTFEPYILSQINHIPLSTRLPSYLTPSRLLAHLLQFASHRGLSNLLTDLPRLPSSGPTSLPSPALVHAIGTAACDFCEDPGHLTSACPHLATLASDPCCRQRLTWLLSNLATTARPPSSGTPFVRLPPLPCPILTMGRALYLNPLTRRSPMPPPTPYRIFAKPAESSFFSTPW